jgi:Tfp pilus assembly protein PilF
LNNLAYLLADNGQADEALKYAQQALELAPDNPDFEDTLGWVLYHKGVYSTAVTHLKSAVSRGGSARQQYHLAMAYFKKGDADLGRAALQTALRRDPNMPEAKAAQQVFQEVQKGRR